MKATRYFLAVLAALFAFSGFFAPAVLAADTVTAVLERITLTSEFSPPSPDPAGIVYLSDYNTLLISDCEVDEMPPYFTGENLFEATLGGSLLGTLTTTSFSNEPTGVGYDPSTRRLFVSDDDEGRIWIVKPGSDGVYNTEDDVLTNFRTSSFGIVDPEDVVFDSWRGHLVVIDGTGEEVWDISPGANGVFDGASGDDQVSHFDTEAMGIHDPEGIAFDTNNGHLYLLSSKCDRIAETTVSGTLIRYIDISRLKTSYGAKMCAGLTYAPSSSIAGKMNLYMVTRGVDNGADPYENDGRIYEISFPPLEPSNNLAPVVNAGADQTITLPGSAALAGTASDDGLPNPPAALTYAWSTVSGPGTVTFGSASSLATTAGFSSAGIYTLRLTVSDSALSSSDDVVVTVQSSTSTNLAPVVNAGADQTITLPGSAALAGTASDDGLPNPPAALTYAWSTVSGPGTVTFGSASSLATTASFSSAGIYALRLTVSDSVLSSSDDVVVTVNDSGGTEPQSFSVRVSAGSDDAEEFTASNGWIYLTGNDLELIHDSEDQIVGMRFNSIPIPAGATILDARVQFTVKDATTGACSLVIRGQAADHATTFTTSRYNISSRLLTSAAVNWTPAAWPAVGAAGPDQQTPNLSSILQEIVSRPGWQSGNSLALIVTGSGTRTASAYERSASQAPQLLVTYSTSTTPANSAPLVNAGADQTITLPNLATLSGTASDDGLPNPPAALTYAWSTVSGPGTVTFGSASSLATTAGFSSAGTYTLRLTVSDSALSSSDDVVVTVQSSTPTNLAPLVNAGADQTITLPGSATLAGTASDDGLPSPPATLTYAWSTVSGPGTVTFGSASSLTTTAGFSSAGTYTLRLTVSDSALSSSDDLVVTVNGSGGTEPQSFTLRVSAGSDDAEEFTASNGWIYLTGNDLELIYDTQVQIVGMRFNNIPIPNGATILDARIQFTVKDATTGACSLVIRGQAADHATTFTTSRYNISSRLLTSAAVNWIPAAWPAVGAAGPDQQTPNLSSVLQEIVSRPGWQSGNSLALIVTGSGTRTASAYERSASQAPQLLVTYSTSTTP